MSATRSNQDSVIGKSTPSEEVIHRRRQLTETGWLHQTVGPKVQVLGARVIRYGLALVIFWIALMKFTTYSFLFSAPGWELSLGGFPALSSSVGHFLIKDVVLLGAGILDLSGGVLWEGEQHMRAFSSAFRNSSQMEIALPTYLRGRMQCRSGRDFKQQLGVSNAGGIRAPVATPLCSPSFSVQRQEPVMRTKGYGARSGDLVDF